MFEAVTECYEVIMTCHEALTTCTLSYADTECTEPLWNATKLESKTTNLSRIAKNSIWHVKAVFLKKNRYKLQYICTNVWRI